MKFLINIHSNSELITYEAIALGFTLASFDHDVQFYFKSSSKNILKDTHSRLYGMLQSLDLYDLSKAWANFDIDDLDDKIQTALVKKDNQPNPTDFDSVLDF